MFFFQDGIPFGRLPGYFLEIYVCFGFQAAVELERRSYLAAMGRSHVFGKPGVKFLVGAPRFGPRMT